MTSEMEQQLDGLWDRLSRCSDTELRLLRLGWEEQSPVQRAAIWGKARSIVRDEGLGEVLDSVRQRVATWAADHRHGSEGESPDGMPGIDRRETRIAAMPPIVDAAASIIAADGLTERERSFLREPFTRIRPHAPHRRSGVRR